jgi:hypothetical protein
MRVLRLRHSLTAGGGGLIAVDYDPGHGASGFTSEVPFLFELTERDRSRLRFYLENFLICPNPAALGPMSELRSDLRRWGEELFRQVFQIDRKAHWQYQEASQELDTLRIEVLSDHPEAWTIPWEILCDPNLGWLAPQVRSFVRMPTAPHEPDLLAPPGEPLRILYVVGRPAGSLEIPFHSVARPLLQISGMLERLRIDFLRPPTFERLAKVMSAAAEEGHPYHVLHFDGHGVFTDNPQDFAGEVDPGFVQQGDRLERRVWTRRRGGARGYLLFEDLEAGETRRLVDGVQIGNLTGRVRTPLVVLHACQSATARVEALERLAADPVSPVRCPASPLGEAPDDHDQDLAFQALSAAIMRFNPRAVVTLPWTLPAATSTRMLSELYDRISGGAPVSEAVGAIRAELLHGLRRDSLLGMVEVDDWLVPLVYDSTALPIYDPGPGRGGRSRVQEPLVRVGTALLPPPAWGFVDRPEILFTLDRAFDVHGTVLLHACAGAGKTSLTRELALWYGQSGALRSADGEPGVILWSSFETYNAMAPLDAFEQAFQERLKREAAWATAGRAAKKAIVLAVLDEVPAFWVWDNVELVGGFPPGSEPLWSADDRRFLAELLVDLSRTRCKVLLVGRQTEEEWLADIPCRIGLPPMPMEERGELTIRITGRQGRALSELASFEPLLKLSQGNPLILSLLLTEALREGVRSPREVRAFLAELPAAGSEGSEAAAELLRGLCERAFGEEDRRRLALLHLFRGYVDLNVLCWMGNPEASWCLPQIRDLGREPWIDLLGRAARAGLLTARGVDCYGVHPPLPFFCRALFDRFWRGAELAAERAFAESTAGLGSYYHREHGAGNRNVIAGLMAQEANLLHARALARRNGWGSAVLNAMQGLETLYTHTGRHEEWARLVRETSTRLEVTGETE